MKQTTESAFESYIEQFELGIRNLIESLMIQRLEENDRIVYRCMVGKDFQDTVFGRLAQKIFETIQEREEEVVEAG